VVGVALVLISVLLGARLLSGQQQTTAVLVAAHALSEGHVIEAGDLRVESLRLSGVSGRYWPGGDAAALSGHLLLGSVGDGDLLPRSAVAGATPPVPYRVVSLPIDPARRPDLHTGDRVDVFATYKATADSAGQTVAVLRDAEYLGADAGESATDVAIRLRVSVADVATVVRASQVADLDIALQVPAGGDAGEVAAAPVTDPSRPVPSPSGAAR
jgi:Flp pilus assembly protein CpaB